MNICELSKLCNNHQLIDIVDDDSKERLFFGFNINIPKHKKWIIKFIYVHDDDLVVYVERLKYEK